MPRNLLHRWFVQYNPIYLVSAMMVLGGMIVLSRGLAHEGSLYGPLGVALIAEVYACSLIAAAALLTRIGQRRPAVLLALLTVVYQSDLTLHTETCAFLAGVGVVAALAWLAFFVGKLYALAWAVRIRLTPRAVVTATVGAVGLTLGPHVVRLVDATTAGAALALLVFALGSLCPLASSDEAATSASSIVPMDDWARTVLRRSVRATWVIWGVLLALHVLFWSTQRSIQLGAVVPAIVLLFARRARKESHVWAAVVALLAAVFLLWPSAFALSAFLSAVTLAHRAFVANDAAARKRLFTGAVFGIYLAAWTLAWRGGSFPGHILALDAALVAAVVLVAWRLRARFALAPLAATCAHGAIASGLVPPPRSLVEWGGSAVALGFLLLIASVVTSYRLRDMT